jgi:hypothetical protein
LSESALVKATWCEEQSQAWRSAGLMTFFGALLWVLDFPRWEFILFFLSLISCSRQNPIKALPWLNISLWIATGSVASVALPEMARSPANWPKLFYYSDDISGIATRLGLNVACIALFGAVYAALFSYTSDSVFCDFRYSGAAAPI